MRERFATSAPSEAGKGGNAPAVSLRRGLPTLSAFILMVIVLLIFNLSSLRLVRLLEASKESDLGQRMVAVGRMIAYHLRQPSPPVILSLVSELPIDQQADKLEDFAATTVYEKLIQRLSEMKRLNNLAALTLLTVQGLVVADADEKMAPASPYLYNEVDAEPLSRAATGQVAQMRLYPIGDTLYKRVYVPIVSEGKPLGILALSASADYFAALREVQRRARVQMILSSALLIAIGVLVHRLFSFIVKAEARALRLARMEAMASLAGGVAHELRNPLSIIRMMCEEILADLPPESRSARNARDIIGEVDRLNELVYQFLSLAKPPDFSKAEPVDLVAEVRRTAELLRKSSPQAFALELNLPTAPLRVQADERALRQVLLNLLLNARDAVAENGGRVSVTVTERRDMAEVRIADTGPGIAQRDLERVFDPFYTTKPTGSGLGLAISRNLVQNMGGEISLTSSLGKGTEVCVRLPLRRSVTLRG